MSFDDRIRSTVDQAISPLVQQLIDASAAERDEAIRAARTAFFEEAEQAAQARVADAEARVRATLGEQIAAARAEDRDAAAREIRMQLEAEGDQKMRDALDAAEARMRTALAEGQAKAAEELRASVAEAQVKERESEMAGVTRLLESVRGLDGATSLSEVLDALALGAAREAARAGVVVLRGDRIQGWRLSGFGARDKQPKSVDLTIGESGVIGLAIGAARAVSTKDSQNSGPGFETLPEDRTGLAVPVIVGGRVVAVVYADAVSMDGNQRHVPSSWPELIEVLARHAGRCLEALTTQKISKAAPPASTVGPASPGQATPAGMPGASGPGGPSAMMQITDGVAAAARRTARLLVSEIRLFHEPAVTEGRRHRNLLSRLAPEIEKARQAYNDQVPPGVRSHTDYFHQELVRTLAGGDAALLGNLF